MITTEDWTFQGTDETLAARAWVGDDDPRFVAILVHGYGEHIGRYEHVATALVDAGGAVYGLDHQGHGRSGGEPVAISDFAPLVEDVDNLVSQASEVYAELPIVMVGHSMGGMIAARYGQVHGDRLAALVLSGPAIGDASTFDALAAMDEIPEIPIDPSVLSRDDSVGAAYASDDLVWHGTFKKQTVQAFADMIRTINDGGTVGSLPLMWIHGEDDQLVPMVGSAKGIDKLAGPNTVRKTYPGARHEVFNETNNDEVIADVTAFIDSSIG